MLDPAVNFSVILSRSAPRQSARTWGVERGERHEELKLRIASGGIFFSVGQSPKPCFGFRIELD